MVILWIFVPWRQIEWTSENQDLGVSDIGINGAGMSSCIKMWPYVPSTGFRISSPFADRFHS